ncbi:MAG TPA: VCBS repeat-containing protein [Phycisphaerae bacterium]|nr:VCBS repeat-containing protein [Phycisphaerae bacterium]HOI55294.1 VCBS repeat-containing protein [Phycisphaerae bacterium]
MRISNTSVAIAVLALLGFCSTAQAVINPGFTPLDLVEQSDAILLLEFDKVNDEGQAVATVKEVLKGESEQKTLTLELLAMPDAFAEQGKMVMKLIRDGQKQGLMFVGMYRGEGMGIDGGDEQTVGFLHLSGQFSGTSQWFNFEQYEQAWDMAKINDPMLGTFAGSTDMLLRCVRYILSDEAATVPVTGGVEWDKESQFATFAGKVRDVRALDLGADAKGRADLFVAADDGDKLYRFSDGKLEDITAKVKLTTKSAAYAWADFNRDGKLDLASWDGKALTLAMQQADGSFEAKPCTAGEALKDGCLALAVVGVGEKGDPALLVSTKASPILLEVKADGSATGKPLVEKDFPGKDLEEAGKCLVADFNNDGVADIVQLFARGSLFYKGTGPGVFDAPVKRQIFAGQGRSVACLGDWDADGLVDIFVTSEDRNRLWHNFGDANFVDMLNVSGEISYHAQGGGCSATTGDFNNDGRQDIFVAYSITMAPQLYFNRGFRSFGQAYEVDLAQQRRLPQAGDGQQAGCLGDFNGDGALDMVIVLAKGEAWLFPRKVEDGQALAVIGGLAVDGPAGPVNIAGWRDKRPLGAMPVRPGDPGAFFGMDEPGPIVLKWQLPGGKAEQKEVVAEQGPVRVLVNKK